MENVVIIGSGPAGLTAAIYASRALLNPLMFEGVVSGGQLMLTSKVDNFPGFPGGVLGPELIASIRNQALRFGARIVSENVARVDLKNGSPFTVVTDRQTVQAKAVIIATGASARLLGLESEARLLGHGVSTCATCDGFFYRGKEIIVVGGGDSALEEANFLTRFASRVTLVHRRDELRASKIMQKHIRENPKITLRLSSTIDEVLGDKTVTGVRLKNVQTGALTEMAVAGVFVAVGHNPNTKLFQGQLDLDENGYIQTRDGGKTSSAGIFACGDVQDRVFRQAVTAAGSGCAAAILCERWLTDH